MNKVRFAVDLGTTNIEICLVDNRGYILSSVSFQNRQALYGSDVINRIYTVARDKSYLAIMRDMVITDLKRNFQNMLDEAGYKAYEVDIICISGNTTMNSILLSYDITTLGMAPFKTPLKESVFLEADALFDDMFSVDTKVIFFGCASAFIGGDILSGMYFLKHNEEYVFSDNGVSLFVDMGTNGEIVLCNNGIYTATSTACGPAFEGCTRKQQVYGCSTIDAISMGINAGKINRNGTLQDQYLDTGIDIMKVHITKDIIEQILSAKSAIYTGILSLINHSGLKLEDVEQVYIAGGFGFYLNNESAVNIGLLPEVFIDKIHTLGNTSLKGACRILNEINIPLEIDTYDIEVFELANDDFFKSNLIENMTFVRT